MITDMREYQRQWRAANPEKQAGYSKKYNERRRGKGLHVPNYRMKTYGMSGDDWERLFLEQAGKCAICSKELSRGYGTCVDHNHATGKVRGLLCRKCNLGIGHLNDSPDQLEAAAKYLREKV